MKKFSTFSLLLSIPFLLPAQEEAPAYHIFSIYFGGGNYYIDPEQTQELYKWLEGIPELENSDITIHSHTDDIGGKEYNDWLSRMRSEAAMQKLINKGLDPSKMSIQDFGELNPVYDNSTWEGKLKNRRVDIIIWPINT